MKFQKLNFWILIFILHLKSQNVISQAFNKTLHLSFLMKKNETGHFNTQWLLKKTSPELPDAIKIDIKSSISEYERVQSYLIQGYITVPPNKPDGYEYHQGIGYYKFYSDGTKKFSDALSACINDGAHLAIINSQAEADVLSTIFRRYPLTKDYAFIGFHDKDVEGNYVTIFGDPLSSTGFMKWATGEPTGPSGTEDCGSFHRSGGLNDINCYVDALFPFICEYDISWVEL